jgi:hypothetical protein
MTITRDQLREATSGGYRTLQAIADDLGVTRERIRQLCVFHGIDRGTRLRPTWDEMTYRQQHYAGPRSRWPREGRPALKARLRLCKRNGCYEDRAPGRVHCPEHLAYLVGASQRLQQRRREQGICTVCGGPAEPGLTMCRPHLDRMNTWHYEHREQIQTSIRARRAARRAAGVCARCENPVEKPGVAQCADHAAESRANNNASREKKRGTAWTLT